MTTQERGPILLVFAGAGLSAESGIPTFRGKDGLWQGHRISEVCDIVTWKKNSKAVHAFYNGRRADLEHAEPNMAHRQLAAWNRSGNCSLVTANIDNLLERAGALSVLHVHGDLTSMMCTACGNKWNVGYQSWDGDVDRCPVLRCNSRKGVKPDVVFFNERAPGYGPMGKAYAGLRPGDAALVIGTSLAVVPVHEHLMGLAGVTTILNVLSEEDILADHTAVKRAFGHILLCPATEAVVQVASLLPWLERAKPAMRIPL